MLSNPLLLKSSANFWPEVASALLQSALLDKDAQQSSRDMSALRVVVPTFTHIQQLKMALAAQIDGSFIPPRIVTLSGWLSLVPPSKKPLSDSDRLMSLYAELRQHAWLKKLFIARRNTDLLPLAQTILKLSDELTQSQLPSLRIAPDAAEVRWQAALAQLPLNAKHVLSDESQLVWTIWKSQLDGNDAIAQRYAQMMQLAERAEEPLVWISPLEPNEMEQAFLQAYGKHQSVLPITLDWRVSSVNAVYASAWPEVVDALDEVKELSSEIVTPNGLSLCAAKSMEEEAQQGAQTILNWLQAGKSQVAIISQDRVVARRMRALLERAQVFVTDETGWKLSTTRAAAVIVAWFDVITNRAETIGLLDFLKSPYLFSAHANKTAQVMAIEIALRRANVLGGWELVVDTLSSMPKQAQLIAQIAEQAKRFTGRKTLSDWMTVTTSALEVLEMRSSMATDAAGLQVLEMLDAMQQDGEASTHTYSFSEWRSLVSMQLETTEFVPPSRDQRVVMMPLNGARLRSFDAVLVVGADADHLPSQLNEVLFFSNAVRRELGLATREQLHCEQLRDFVEVLSANDEVVLSWQAHKDGEPNPISPWIARLQLALARSGSAELPQHHVEISTQRLTATPTSMPGPSAPQLIPAKLSASGYNSLVACPYQFFATRMLGLSGLDELSDMPEKRDYGDWLHQILKIYHETLRDQKTDLTQREILLKEISEKILGAEQEKNAAALAYYVRWQKVMPAYLVWANEREAQGWRFEFGEQWLERTLTWPDGTITLHGRVDRIDVHDNGERAVLDYKTQSHTVLNAKIKLKEDHQLAFYGLLSDGQVNAAHYVALELTRGKTGDVAAPDYDAWLLALDAQIKDGMQAIAGGAPLFATGIESICQFCDVRGLCRKGTW
ncbi:MAG TPA: PD-(D/E)XK nuclease family protein [Burkholderiaceae bacterium]|jgi:ATP-dependent helicase/nuclease subunit B